MTLDLIRQNAKEKTAAELGAFGAGGGGLTVEFKAVNFVAEASREYVLTANMTAITFPAGNDGDVIRITRDRAGGVSWDTSAITITPDGSETLDGDATFQLDIDNADFVYFIYQSSGTNWVSVTPLTPDSAAGNGAIITAWTNFNMVVESDSSTALSPTAEINEAWYRQVGDNLELRWDYFASAADGTTGSGNYRFQLPTGFTIDSSRIEINSDVNRSGVVGQGRMDRITANVTVGQLVAYDSTHVALVGLDFVADRSPVGAGNYPLGVTNIFAHMTASIPVAELQNSGTTVALSDLTARTKWVDDSVLDIGGASSGLVNPPISVTFAKASAYRDSAGDYHLRFNVRYTSTPSVTATEFRFTGITTSTAGRQAASGANDSGSTSQVTVQPTNIIESQGGSTNTWSISGDILLDSKPTWFDANAENSQSIDALIEPTVGNGTIITEWEDFTPSFSGLSSYTAGYQKMRRVGETMEIITSGTATSNTSVSLAVPDGLNVLDVVTTGSRQTSIGWLQTDSKGDYEAYMTSGNTIRFWSGDGGGDLGTTSTVSGVAIRGHFWIPIAEWQSSGTTVALSDLTAKTKWVDDSVLQIVSASAGLDNNEKATTVEYATAMAYRDSAGQYRLRFNLRARRTVDGDDYQFLIAGVSLSSDNISIGGGSQSKHNRREAMWDGVNGYFTIGIEGGGFGSKEFMAFGDVPLTGKPSWFDANAENSLSIDALIDNATATTPGLVEIGPVVSGSYIPQLPSSSNMDAVGTPGTFYWSRSGNMVTVIGNISGHNPKADSSCELSLPTDALPTSNFSANGQATGFAGDVQGNTVHPYGTITHINGSKSVNIAWRNSFDPSAFDARIHFSYVIDF